MLGHILIQIPEGDNGVDVYISNHKSGDSSSGWFESIDEGLDWAIGWLNAD